jgi:hypothetical protein
MNIHNFDPEKRWVKNKMTRLIKNSSHRTRLTSALQFFNLAIDSKTTSEFHIVDSMNTGTSLLHFANDREGFVVFANELSCAEIEDADLSVAEAVCYEMGIVGGEI